jgi:uncharacterized protein (TIGR04255 family)
VVYRVIGELNMFEYKDIYPNSPLVEVVFEIRFPGEPRVECNRDIFYEKIRGDFPNVLVPSVKTGEFPALEPYRFESEDKLVGMMVAINKFAYYVRKYPGYSQFSKEVLKWGKEFVNIYRISNLNRSGLRCINIIPFSRESGLIPLNRFLKIRLALPEVFPDNFENLNLVFISKTSGGAITTKIESMISVDRSHEAILLDFDYAKEKELTIESIDQYLEESHAYTKRMFEELITDEYRQYLKGDTI